MENLQNKTEYCLNCKNKPCQLGCPLGNDIPEFIRLAKEHKYKEAYEALSKTTVMPFICGKICPKSKQCQGKCIRGIKGQPVSIGEIENAIGEMAIQNKWYEDVEKPATNGKKIAIIGAGPAGITASIWLAKNGWKVKVFEKHKKIGGILRYGIPEFRLEKRYIDVLEQYMQKLGIIIETNKMLGKDFEIKELLEKYSTVFLSEGANVSNKMGIPGEELGQVMGANELLEYENHPDYSGKKIIVIGGGNVAMDAARTIKRMGAKEVTVVYRRAIEQMPAEPKEVEEARNEGINFLFQVNVKSIESKKAYCIRTQLVQKDGEARLVPVEIPESKFAIDADYVVMAIGAKLNNTGVENIELTEKGYIKIDEMYKTSIPHVYAAGDNTGGVSTVAWASFYGREAAKNIDKNE